MSISEDDLRAGLRNYADQAGPARFPAEPVIRRVRRRRTRFMAAVGGCAVAVAAAVVVVAEAPAHPVGRPPSYVLPPPAPAKNGPWGTSLFDCNQPLPAGLPGAAGYGLGITVGPITRTASGQPHVTWYMTGTDGPEHETPSFGRAPQAFVLVVRGDGTIAAVLTAGLPANKISFPLDKPTESASEIARAQPRITPCQPSDWSQVWAHHQEYGVVVLMTAWGGYSGADPARFSAAAVLPSG